MNTNNVVSAVVSTDLTGKEYYCVKVTSTGLALAGGSDYATFIGTMIRATPHQESGVYAGLPAAVQLKSGSIHFAVIGFSSATVARGATLILDTAPENAGKLVPGSSNAVAIAWDGFTAQDGMQVQVYFLD